MASAICRRHAWQSERNNRVPHPYRGGSAPAVPGGRSSASSGQIFLLTLVLPKAVDVLFSEKPLRSLPNLWPILEVIVHHPIWTLLTFLGLLLLTGLFWFGSRERATTTRGTLSEHDRIYMLQRLRLRYEQMLAQSLQGA